LQKKEPKTISKKIIKITKNTKSKIVHKKIPFLNIEKKLFFGLTPAWSARHFQSVYK
jgi:hypothetical protein